MEQQAAKLGFRTGLDRLHICIYVYTYISIMSRRVPSGLMEEEWGCVEGVGNAHNVLASSLFILN